MSSFICPVGDCEKQLSRLQIMHFRSTHDCEPVEWVNSEYGSEIREQYASGSGSYTIAEKYEWLSSDMVCEFVETRSRGEALEGENNPMKRDDVASQFSGENNPAKRPEVREKLRKSAKGNTHCELPRPTALGPTRPSLVAVGASCFCVGTCIRRGHSGSRLRRRFPFTGGSECPTPTASTLGHNRRCTLLVAFEQRRTRGECLTTLFDRRGSKAMPYNGSEDDDGRCIPSLLAPSALAEEGGLAPCTTQAKQTKEKISRKNSGNVVSEAHREKISEAASNRDASYMQTEEYSRALSESLKGREPTYRPHGMWLSCHTSCGQAGRKK